MQFGTRYRVLSNETEVSKGPCRSGSKSDGEENETLVFKVDVIPLHCMCAVGTYNRFPSDITRQHTRFVEKAIHFWRVGSSLKKFLQEMSIRGHGNAPTTLPWSTNVMNHISLILAWENFVFADDGNPERSCALHREREGVLWMKGVTPKFHGAQTNIGWPLCKYLCLRKSLHVAMDTLTFFGCKINTVCFREVLVGDVEVFARQMANEELDIVREEDVQPTPKCLGVFYW